MVTINIMSRQRIVNALRAPVIALLAVFVLGLSVTLSTPSGFWCCSAFVVPVEPQHPLRRIHTTANTTPLQSKTTFTMDVQPFRTTMSTMSGGARVVATAAASSRGTSTTTARQMSSLDDWIYQTQTAASSLATLSLTNDPSNLWTSLPLLYAAGLLTSFSPCVWGLLPLTLSYISQAAGERQDHQTAIPTLAFAAGLATVFCSLGVAAVELGGVFGVATAGSAASFLPILSNGICLTMGFKLLDLIDIPLPSYGFLSPNTQKRREGPILIDGTGQILSSSTSSTSTSERGSLFRTFLLGGSSALVASPCATPVLTSILAFVANASNPSLGAFLLLGYTLGYATPLLLVAASGGQALQNLRQGEAGAWYAQLAPWVTPITGGVLLWSGTSGMLTALLGDPSLAGLAIL